MTVYYTDDQVTLHHGRDLDVLRTMPDGSVNCVVTSPPYFGLRDYGVEPTEWPEVTYSPMPGAPEITVPAMTCALGLEPTPNAFVAHLLIVFAEVRRVLADDGTCWLNLGDSYSTWQGKPGSWRVGEYLTAGKGKVAPARNRNGTAGDVPAKNLLGIPWRVAFALQEDGWTLRNAIVWAKPNAMPESVTDRLSTRYELVFLLTKARRYWFDLDAIKEPLTSTPEEYAAAAASVRANHALGQVNGRPINKTSFASVPTAKNPGDYWEIDDEPFTLTGGTITADEAAYIAAFIDGEGSIIIRRRARQIQLILTVVNTHEGVIRWLRDRTGMGQVKQREVRNDRWRQVWEWSVTSREAAQVIYAVYPHFRVKRQQAAVALHFMATTRDAGGGVAPDAYHEKRHAMAEDMAALNAGRITESRFAFAPDGPPRMASKGDVWAIPTAPFAEAHFAVMPLALAERCIQAGCPLEVCAKCGEPRRRLMEKGDLVPTVEGYNPMTQHQAGHVGTAATERDIATGRANAMPRRERAMTGWSDCGHGAYRPGVVLDPYSGSGTTGHAALRNGRRYIGIDLNADYHDLSLRTRLQQGALIPDTEVAP